MIRKEKIKERNKLLRLIGKHKEIQKHGNEENKNRFERSLVKKFKKF